MHTRTFVGLVGQRMLRQRGCLNDRVFKPNQPNNVSSDGL